LNYLQQITHFSSNFLFLYFSLPLGAVLKTTSFFHVTGLALNRLQAVFFPLSYQRVWKKR